MEIKIPKYMQWEKSSARLLRFTDVQDLQRNQETFGYRRETRLHKGGSLMSKLRVYELGEKFNKTNKEMLFTMLKG